MLSQPYVCVFHRLCAGYCVVRSISKQWTVAIGFEEWLLCEPAERRFLRSVASNTHGSLLEGQSTKLWIFNQASNSQQSLVPCWQVETLSSGVWVEWTLGEVLSKGCTGPFSPKCGLLTRETPADRQTKRNSRRNRAHASRHHGGHPQPGNCWHVSIPNPHHCESPPVHIGCVFWTSSFSSIMFWDSGLIYFLDHWSPSLNPIHVFTLIWCLLYMAPHWINFVT